MSSNIKIERICEWCGNRFMAQTTVTRFCSKRCAEHSYKERMRQKKMALSNQETSQCNPDRKSRDKDFLTPTETAQFLGVCRTYIYDSINRGKIKVTRIGRKTLISKADIQAMFDFLTPKETELPETAERKSKSISDFYTRAEIREKFGLRYILWCRKLGYRSARRGRRSITPNITLMWPKVPSRPRMSSLFQWLKLWRNTR